MRKCYSVSVSLLLAGICAGQTAFATDFTADSVATPPNDSGAEQQVMMDEVVVTAARAAESKKE
ncbi:hypothetical protein VU00_10691, partial [Candidatus Electrothrix marina]